MSRATATIIDHAKSVGVMIREISTREFLKVIENMKSGNEAYESGICQSDDMIEYMRNFGSYDSDAVRIWLAYFNENIVGIMMMAGAFNAAARARSLMVPRFIPLSNYFSVSPNQISDMLAICARDFPGLGKLLTLIALAESGPRGLFLQVQQIYTEMKEPHPENPNHFVYVRRTSVSAAAKVIYNRYGFKPIQVSNSEEIIENTLFYYRDTPLQQPECVELLLEWDKSWTNKRTLRTLEEKKRREDEIEAAALQYQNGTYPELDFGDGDVALVDIPHEFDRNQLFALDINNGPNIVNHSESLARSEPLQDSQGGAEEDAQFQSPQDRNLVYDFLNSPAVGRLNNRAPAVVNPHEQKYEVHSPPKKRSKNGARKPVTFECEICHKVLNRIDNYKRHLKTHDATREYKCPTCGKEFYRRDDLKTHVQRTHEGLRDYPCPYCKHQSGNTSDLYKHIREMHPSRSISRHHSSKTRQ